jgi:hypothetical protein
MLCVFSRNRLTAINQIVAEGFGIAMKCFDDERLESIHGTASVDRLGHFAEPSMRPPSDFSNRPHLIYSIMCARVGDSG